MTATKLTKLGYLGKKPWEGEGEVEKVTATKLTKLGYLDKKP